MKINNLLDSKNKIYYNVIKLKKLELRITPIIWFGGLYQEPVIPDYEEDTFICIFFVIRNFLFSPYEVNNICKQEEKVLNGFWRVTSE